MPKTNPPSLASRASLHGGLAFEFDFPSASLEVLAGKMPALMALATTEGALIFSNGHFELLDGAGDTVESDTEAGLFPAPLRLSLTKQANPHDTVFMQALRYLDGSEHIYEIHRFKVPAVEEGRTELICTLGVCQTSPTNTSPPQFDPLTGLANRAQLYEQLRRAIDYGRAHRECVTVMMLNIDRFKNINDSLGVGAGDDVLIQISEILRNVLRDNDTVARLGSDEFILLLDKVDNPHHITKIADKILKAIGQPLNICGHEITCTASLGVSQFPIHGDSIDLLLKHADEAMARAKSEGKNRYKIYTAQMSERTVDALLMENDLRRALEQDEFILFYQPQVHLRTGKIIGLEALIRWQHKTKGVISPLDFIPLAEETGLIEEVGAWVLTHACERFHHWLKHGLSLGKVAVNLSARQFRQAHFAETVVEALNKSKLPPQYLELEITESLTMQDTDEVLQTLGYLNKLGLSIAIDDFGTGYSSLSYLKKFPVNKLKIDRTFIHDVGSELDDGAIAKSIIDLAHNMSMLVVAEGVERLGQSRWLYDQGCDQVQGYYFCKPLSENELLKLLYSEKIFRDSNGDCFIV
ncbi:putative bifunctional diguanylate cyclase/phosphodiesterase [Saccharophagus degradans]|uniref:cyclic-guanylate-specific phosphodiesterase n=1 Tax=Saccharophagus degradans TaxID=86304 RepID=A0AAW7X9M7_9GAMM|nr:bifunctional diguanylate cyclase/phosphodiesterase [Saccharophagus degradans]MDO6424431.1 bifunctional diguanylate cyclase/phosphodiesterase [Saccharophagus degradans]MDO6608362.1 bifunctional diguanylate cyclase/phosphodiesterase [Saccharophagus degradans]